MNSVHKMFEYKTKQLQWEKYSAVRSRPRRMMTDEYSAGYLFPPLRQPLCVHPKIVALGEEVKQFILTQSLYKYMNDIATIETDLINHAAHQIFRDGYKVKFSRDIKHDALSIIIDESYHAYAAHDFMYQISEYTNIPILSLQNKTELSCAIQEINKQLSKTAQKNFELISICIAEHALTNDLIAVAKLPEVSKIFYYVMHDHVLDENRHALFFETVLDIFWGELLDDEKDELAFALPQVINLYLAPTLQKEFDRSVLQALDLPQYEIEQILNETHCGWKQGKIYDEHIIAKQMIDLLKRSHVFEYPAVTSAFKQYSV